MSKKDSSTRSPGTLRKVRSGRNEGTAAIDCGWSLRLDPEIVRRDRERARWGLLRSEPRLLTERSGQLRRVRLVRRGGQETEGMVRSEKGPASWRRWRRGGQGRRSDSGVESVMEVVRGRRRERSFGR